MLFKGTSQKSAIEIIKVIEGLGGSFDAFTTKENLLIITKFLAEHITVIFDLIAELLLESTIAHEELSKEKSVVLEEIKSNNEDPAEYVFDLFYKSLFSNHPMGLPIAGSVESVNTMSVEKTKIYYQELWKQRMVIALSGNFDYEQVVKLAQTKLSQLELGNTSRIKPHAQCGNIVVQKRKEISQVHFVFGNAGVEFQSPRRYPLSILNTVFGGGMSSRLFQGLREQHGLVYNVQSFHDFYSDCGISGFYFVCDKKNLKGVAHQLRQIFDDIHKSGFSNEEIDLAKTYLSGNLLLNLETSTNRMLRLGKEMSHTNKISTIDETLNHIRSLDTDQINELIKDYLNPHAYTVAAIGPIEKHEVEDIVTSIIS
jgi:predicted Zn-dependent peptidase